jgi:hypothetical protein
MTLSNTDACCTERTFIISICKTVSCYEVIKKDLLFLRIPNRNTSHAQLALKTYPNKSARGLTNHVISYIVILSVRPAP